MTDDPQINDHPEDPIEDAAADATPPADPPSPAVGAEESEEIPGGVQTTDPTFADGAQEVDTYSNQPREEPAAE